MATNEYDNNYSGNGSSFNNELHHLRRDARDSHTSSQLAKWLSIIALVVAAIALATSVAAYNKAGDAQSTANQAKSTAESRQ